MPGGSSDEVESNVFDGCDVCRSVICLHSASVVSDDHVHHPMQADLDRPVIAHERSTALFNKNSSDDQ